MFKNDEIGLLFLSAIEALKEEKDRQTHAPTNSAPVFLCLRAFLATEGILPLCAVDLKCWELMTSRNIIQPMSNRNWHINTPAPSPLE